MYGALSNAEREHLLAARPADAVAVDPEEEERLTKRERYDLSVVVDNPWLHWIGPALRVLALQRDKPVWPFGYPLSAQMLKKASQSLGLQLVPRHSGGLDRQTDQIQVAG